MSTIHDNLQVAYQCCSTTLRLILKYRTNLTQSTSGFRSSSIFFFFYLFFFLESLSKKSRDHQVFFSAKVLEELIEHLDTALAFLLTEIIQSNRPKELQVRTIV